MSAKLPSGSCKNTLPENLDLHIRKNLLIYFFNFAQEIDPKEIQEE